MGRCLARPNAVLALVNGVLISDRVKLRHEVVVSLGKFFTLKSSSKKQLSGRLVTRNPGSNQLSGDYKIHLENQLRSLIMSEVVAKNENVNLFVASALTSLLEISVQNVISVLSDLETKYTAFGTCFASFNSITDLPAFSQLLEFLDNQVWVSKTRFSSKKLRTLRYPIQVTRSSGNLHSAVQ